MLYPRSNENKLDVELFKNPGKEYRGAPFWAWNTKITRTHIENTLSELKEMGMGGAHIHSRTGMNVPYLSKDFMELIRYSHEYAKDKDMLTWLYDEDRWPSGAAGGLVTREEEYRSRFLVFSSEELSEYDNNVANSLDSSAKAVRSNNRSFLAKYEILLKDGFLADYRRIEQHGECREGYDAWYAYLEISGNSAWFNNQAYLNTLDPSAVKRFVEVTHDTYYHELGNSFGSSIPAIFTDEPQFSPKTMLSFAKDKVTLTIPYTDDFELTYKKSYGVSFLEHLPEIFWDLPELEVSVHRYQYHDHVCERFAKSFADTVGSWCKEHNIMLAGHMMQEPTLYSQTSSLGEAMRSYRSFGLPGIDMLCDRRELTTAKQAQSAAHQFNCPGVLSEIYGVTNWDFDFRGHKLAGDWQAALGVTVRVPHLTWTSMAGEAKRDYPASIGYQSPWYREYSLLEDYFARINTALTRGKALVKVGVIHPIESYWLFWGTKEHTEGIRREMDHNFQQLVDWLLYGLIDFDFIAESLLPQLQSKEEMLLDGFVVGAMKYEVIIVPNCVTLRRTTMDRLVSFVKSGGRVIFAGRTPTHIDAVSCREIEELVAVCSRVEFSENEILNSLTPYRSLEVRNAEGMRTSNLLYQLRTDGVGRWLFLSHSEKMRNPDLPKGEELILSIDGSCKLQKYNTFTGEISVCRSFYEKGRTYWRETVYDHDSLLYYLEPYQCESTFEGNEDASSTAKLIKSGLQELEQEVVVTKQNNPSPIRLSAKNRVKLSEPNVLVLDMAQYRFDEEAWQEEEELLRIDNRFRQKLGYPIRTEAYAQPWLRDTTPSPEHQLSLRFRINTEYEVISPVLALEEAEDTRICLNGIEVPSMITGWYTDRDINTISLPGLKLGENILEVTIPYHSYKNVEYLYLLGDFSVQVAGRCTLLQKPIREISFGDICMQGLPFYGGNLTYELPIQTTTSGSLRLEITRFRCPLMKIALDGEQKGYIAFSPYSLELGEVEAGEHIICITAFGNRVNTFGPIHNCNHTEHWIGPDAWRSEGAAWAYEYQLKKTGILVSPRVTLWS